MLTFDEGDHLLVAHPFTDGSTTTSVTSDHDVPVTLAYASSGHDPLRSRSTLPEGRSGECHIPSITVVDSDSGTRPGMTRLLCADGLPANESVEEAPSEVPQGASDTIVHTVGPTDSFASVAVRYGVSIAALRRVNHLWPSDPIHLRTELLIPRSDALLKPKSTRNASTDTLVGSIVEPSPGLSPALVASTFVTARNIIASVLPARISLESLSSKTSVSEDHELDDLRSARAPLAVDPPPFAQEGHALAVLTPPHTQHRWPAVMLPSQVPCPPTDNQRLGLNHIPLVSDLRSRPTPSSRTVSLEHLPRTQPFATLPVRTSQLEPEPAMELPVRRRIFRPSSLDG